MERKHTKEVVVKKMKKIKKITRAALLLMCFACVSGCGKGKKEEVPVSEESEIPEVVTYEASKEILGADPYQGYVQIGKKVVQLPMDYQELQEELQFQLVSYEEVESDEYLVDERSVQYAQILLDDLQNTLVIAVENTTEEKQTIKDCRVTRISEFTSGSVFYPGGITIGSTLEEVTTILGEPYYAGDDDEELSHAYAKLLENRDIPLFQENEGNPRCSAYEYGIDFDRNTSTVKAIECNFSNQVDTEYEDYTWTDSWSTHWDKAIGLRPIQVENGEYRGLMYVEDIPYLVVFTGASDDLYSGFGRERYSKHRDLISENIGGTEEPLTAGRVMEYLILPDDKKMLKEKENGFCAVSYEENANYIYGHLLNTMYLQEEQDNVINEYLAVLCPVEGDEIPAEAISKFKEIIEHMGETMVFEQVED